MVENKKIKSYYGSKAEVYHGTARYTKGELTKRDIIRIDDGYGNYRYKSRHQQKKGRRKNAPIHKWNEAVQIARETNKIKGFVPVGGATRKGKALLKTTRLIYKLNS